MDEREAKIVEAAVRVFSRYGVRRTTMNDIAGEAGVVRQTLYNIYANKDDVLRATIRWHTDHALSAIAVDLANAADLGESLDIIFKHLVVRPFEMVRASPHADEILDGLNTVAAEEIVTARARYRDLLETVLTPHGAPIRDAGLTPRQLADMIQIAWYGFKHKAKNKKHLVELLNTLKALVLGLTEPA